MPTSTRCPKCFYGLDGHDPGESGTVQCPECGKWSCTVEMQPRTRPRWPIWRAGTIPAAIIGMPIALAWVYAVFDGLAYIPVASGPWEFLTLMCAIPGWPTAAVCCVVGMVGRVRQVDPGQRWRVGVLSTLMMLAWVAPVFAGAYLTIDYTISGLANI